MSFPSGRELLSAYWGLLAHGGLVLGEPQLGAAELHEGEAVLLHVAIESSRRRYRLRGQVVRCPQHTATPPRERVVIAFDPGEPHDLLVSDAYADAENVPARRHRRFAIDAPVRWRAPTSDAAANGAVAEGTARLVNMSYGGCCLRVPHGQPPVDVGAPLRLLTEYQEIVGTVRWAHASCRGIEFHEADPAAVEQFVRRYL